jgi:hypothetical protein
MCEYALTSNGAIPYHELHAGLAAMQEAVRNFPNMILVPGSIASFEEIECEKRLRQKSQTLLENHDKLRSDPNIADRWMIVKARTDWQDKTTHENELKVDILLRNCFYVMTLNGMAKRHNSVPFFEYKMLKHRESESLFYIGHSDPVLKINTSRGEFNLAVLFCVEQKILKLKGGTRYPDTPIVQVVSSDTVDMDHDNIFSALCIQMDSKHGLNGLKVVMNYNHCQAHQIDDVLCFVYDSNNPKSFTEQTGVIAFGGEKFDNIPVPEVNEENMPHKSLRRQGHPFLLHQAGKAWPKRFDEEDVDSRKDYGLK